jgi:hypothetical protein
MRRDSLPSALICSDRGRSALDAHAHHLLSHGLVEGRRVQLLSFLGGVRRAGQQQGEQRQQALSHR